MDTGYCEHGINFEDHCPSCCEKRYGHSNCAICHPSKLKPMPKNLILVDKSAWPEVLEWLDIDTLLKPEEIVAVKEGKAFTRETLAELLDGKSL